MHNPAALGTMSIVGEQVRRFHMAPQHPPRFLKIVDDAKTRVRETNAIATEARAQAAK